MYTAEEFDETKTKILKYIIYKKRTEQEIRQKFATMDCNILEDVIEYLKQADYINDNNYIKKAVNEFMALKSMSVKELSYKLMLKGLNKTIINDYIYANNEELLAYEINSAKNIYYKKIQNTDIETIKKYLYQKGYMEETINIALKGVENNNE